MKIFYFLIFSFSISIFSVEKETSEYLTLGDKNYANKNFREALANYKTALTKNSGSIRANLGFAKTSYHLGSRVDAESGYKKALEIDSKNKEAISGLAEVYADYGKYSESLDLIEAGLKDDPYNQILLIARASVLLKSGKKDLALTRLEEARKRVPETLEFRLLLARVYIANKRFEKAELILNELISKYPEQAETFVEKAELNFEKLQLAENQKKLMKETESVLKTALALDGDNVEAKRLMIKNQIWLAKFDKTKYDDAEKYTNELLDLYPNDPFLQYISGYIKFHKSENEMSSDNYSKLLELEELNEIGRFSAENYSINNQTENHELRTKLLNYRLEQYRVNKQNYLNDIAYFHLMRAEKLSPSNPELIEYLKEYYYNNKYLYHLLKVLIRARDNDVEDMKIHNRLENVFHRYKQTLLYKEGFTDENGNRNETIFTGTEIFIFDPSPEQTVNSYPDSSLQISSAIKFAFNLSPLVKVVRGKEEEKIRNLIIEKKGSEAYTNGVYYSNDILEYINQFRKTDNLIRYIGLGSFKEEKNKISVIYKLYDRTSGKFVSEVNATAENRSALADISTRITKKFISVLPIEGRILKIKPQTVIINLGSRHGIKKDDEFSVNRNLSEIGKIKITNIDEYISEGIPVGKNWSRDFQTKDKIILEKK